MEHVMDEHECSAEPNTPGTVEATRRTVIETGSTALLLTTLPRAALAAGPVDDNEPPPPLVDPLKSKGIGELGICDAGASIANAVYNACGVRIRDYPITLDKLLSKLPVRA
jgi:hypothetical protein